MNNPATSADLRADNKASTFDIVQKSLAKRRSAERRFKAYGLTGIMLGLMFLLVLFTSIIGKGYTAFVQTQVKLDIYFDAEWLDPEHGGDDSLAKADYNGLIKKSLSTAFPEVTERRDKRDLYAMVSSGAGFLLREMVVTDKSLLGKTVPVWLPADDDIDMLMKGHIDREQDQANRRVNDKQLAWIDRLSQEARIEKHFNALFFTAGDSREPEMAGIRGALMGSLLTLIGTFLLSFPIGVATAVYLEEFAPINKFTDFIEVNINNLAAVPSIVFGLLGLAMFINFFGLPRSTPIIGCLVLTLMTLPTIIIAGRASLKSVPPSIREAALGMGASKLQTITHHVLPLAMPGMMTGSIIGMARALGETAPLLMIGMVAFIVDVPTSFTQPSTVLPVQIYLWADSPERAFVERTSAAIMVLLFFLISMNGLAVYLRRRYERRW
ncbi:phosphate ABC transporter permease PstA [Methylicorpusculum sp.]|uniref:phosphate ABC transporter permease PstA n=1 Tax=Methylicorpusculum sp. TaxID=2713644 RepID=UPI0027232E69|nr:phosphate ABC transporter permease PstA [Methylicorpusculum sp.]MDO8845631.1 phosphate ABC transporter permease PstA [Methylicorpusculum sp.]